MSTTWEIQRQLFENIKSKNGERNDWVQELESVLHVSKDAVYRRLRGDTLLNLEDLRQLASVYKISIDQLIHTSMHTLVSDFQALPSFTLEKYLEQMRDHFLRHQGRELKIYFNARELPIFYLFQFPDLLSLKHFFWQNTFLDKRGENQTFEPCRMSARCLELSREILNIYLDIPSVELWSGEIFTSTLSQIAYYHELGSIKTEDRNQLIAQLLRLLDNLEKMAIAGFKNTERQTGKLELYHNEILPGDNTVVAESGTDLQAFLTQQVVNSVVINDPHFCQNALHAMQSIVEKSTLISAAAEKTRRKFFLGLRKQIEASSKA